MDDANKTKKTNQQYQVDLQKLNINNAHALLYSAVTLSFFSLKINVKKKKSKIIPTAAQLSY